MRARFASLAVKAARFGIAAEILTLVFSAGVVVGFLLMALAMAGLTNSPNAAALVRAQVERLR